MTTMNTESAASFPELGLRAENPTTPQPLHTVPRRKMNAKTARRAQYVKALDMIARSVNDEELHPLWLTYGVADEDIDADTTPEQIAAMGYCEDETFRGLLDTFAQLMREATKDGTAGTFYHE